MTTTKYFALIYASKALKHFSEEELQHLSQKAEGKNARLGITGYLNYREDIFFQFLQGERAYVLDMERKVKMDPRHKIISTLYFYDLTEIIFPKWSMRYLSNDFMHEIQQEEILESILTKLLKGSFDEAWARKAVLNMLQAIKYRNQRTED